jgi:hypothetical protein
MMYFSKFEDVFFVEGNPPGAVTIRPISTQHDGFFSQSQLKSLDTLKKVMAAEVDEEDHHRSVVVMHVRPNDGCF